MAAQYWVGDFFVDLTRNQITHQAQSQTMPPKALAVLTYLAKNARKVISHDELLSNVWPDTVVTPNTLQRSITQLRKALVKDSQQQSYIKTHAKQGYSLEVVVRWQDKDEEITQYKQQAAPANTASSETKPEITQADPVQTETAQTETAQPEKTKPAKITPKHLVILAGIVIIALIAGQLLKPEQSFKLSFGSLRSLTATDNQELGGIYSPDGQYVVFHRYSPEFCNHSHIWAKNTKTQQETQLTKEMAAYGSHSFSQDGKQLVFIESYKCNQPITQKKCYKLMSFDFAKALVSPKAPKPLMECKNSRISSPKWLNNGDIVLLQQSSVRWELTLYSIANNKSTVIYSQNDGNLIDFDYSTKDNLLALISIHSDEKHYIEILQPDGQVLSSHPIEYPQEIARFNNIYPNFMPHHERLIFSTGKQLFTLSYTGKVTNNSLLLDEPMGSPVFHPDGKRMLVIKGHYDSDIVTMPLSPLNHVQTTQAPSNNYTTIERSILEDDNAKFQPNGELIAFISDRSGDDQLWITQGNDAQQLTHFQADTMISSIDWAADGQSVLLNLNNQLAQVKLDSSQKNFELPLPVVQLLQWDSQNNKVLAMARIKGIEKLVEIDLNDSTFIVITDKHISWALKSEDGRLIYTDTMDRFWQPGPAEDKLIEALVGQATNSRQFLIKDNVVYGINEEFQLWAYSLNKGTIEVLATVPKSIDALNDINQSQLLMTLSISRRKEVAELILAD